VANPRVHEISSVYGVQSKVALQELMALGVFVKGPSSSIAPSVARKLRARLELLGYSASERTPAFTSEDLAGTWELVKALPRALPALVDALHQRETITRNPVGFPSQFMADRHFYYLSQNTDHLNRGGVSVMPEELPADQGVLAIRVSVRRLRFIAWQVAGESLHLLDLSIARYGEDGNVRATAAQGETCMRHAEAFTATTGLGRDALEALTAALRSIPPRPVASATRRDEAANGSKPARPSDSPPDAVRILNAYRQAVRVDSDASSGHKSRNSRWVVRSHYRQQWYSSTGEHKRILIEQHEAGATDSVLTHRDVVYVIAPM